MKDKKILLKCKGCGQVFSGGFEHHCSATGLKAENIRLREALAFYANQDNYFLPPADTEKADYLIALSVIRNDSGRIASKALEGTE